VAMAEVALVVTGASSGLGEGLARELVWELAAGAGRLRVFLSARRLERLQAVREQLLSVAVAACRLEVEVDAVDGSNAAAVEQYCAALRQRFDAGNGGGRVTRVVALLAAGSHERASTKGAGGWRYSEEGDFSAAERQAAWQLNVATPLRFFACLSSWAATAAAQAVDESTRDVRCTLAYLSSEAVEAKWWALGNSLYGPAKRAAEAGLLAELAKAARGPCRTRLALLRYPLVDTPMASALYGQLLRVDAQCCGPRPTFAQLAPACGAGAALVAGLANGLDGALPEGFSPCSPDEDGIGRCAFRYAPSDDGVPATAVTF